MRFALPLHKKKKIAVQTAVFPCTILNGFGVLRAMKTRLDGQKTQ